MGTKWVPNEKVTLAKSRPHIEAGYVDNCRTKRRLLDKEVMRYSSLSQFITIMNSSGLLQKTDTTQKEKCPVILQGTSNK